MATYSGGSLSANGARTPGASNTDFHKEDCLTLVIE